MTDYFTAAATAGLDYATDAAERQEAAGHDAMADRIIAELPAVCTTHYLDYQDDLREHPEMLQAYIDGDWQTLDQVDEWYTEARWEGEHELIHQAADAAGVDDPPPDVEERVLEVVWERDDFNPVQGLIDNTGDVLLRARLVEPVELDSENLGERLEYDEVIWWGTVAEARSMTTGGRYRFDRGDVPRFGGDLGSGAYYLTTDGYMGGGDDTLVPDGTVLELEPDSIRVDAALDRYSSWTNIAGPYEPAYAATITKVEG